MKRLLPFLLPVVALAADEKLPPFQMSVQSLDPAFNELIAPDAEVEKLAEGFNWSEGPAWYQGALVFSDVPENIIYRWKPGATSAEIFLKPSGMTVPTPGFQEQGSNGIGVDAKGNLVICQHGDRRLARLNADGKTFTTIANRYDGKRFSSPNDLTYHKSGAIYFTDPPYGLKGLNDSPIKEMPFNGVYRVDTGGKVSLVVKDLTFPNGIALSPDEKILYVAVSDPKRTVIMAYDVQPDGSVANGRIFFDAEAVKKPGLKGGCDGMKVDAKGNIFTSGPGGILVISPAGKHLGTILTNQQTGNCCFGGEDGSELYICADMYIARVKTKTKGKGM
jgi:gluconolactonase